MSNNCPVSWTELFRYLQPTAWYDVLFQHGDLADGISLESSKVVKQGPAQQTASLLFEQGFSGAPSLVRAELILSWFEAVTAGPEEGSDILHYLGVVFGTSLPVYVRRNIYIYSCTLVPHLCQAPKADPNIRQCDELTRNA